MQRRPRLFASESCCPSAFRAGAVLPIAACRIAQAAMTPTHLALTREIETFRLQFEQISQDVCALVNPLSDEQFTWQPTPDSWSVAQCIEHLNVSARLYLPKLDEGIADAIRRGTYGEGPFAYNVIGRFFTALMEPPARMNVKAPKAVSSTAARPRQEVMAAFKAYQVQFVDRLRQANGLGPGARQGAVHPRRGGSDSRWDPASP